MNAPWASAWVPSPSNRRRSPAPSPKAACDLAWTMRPSTFRRPLPGMMIVKPGALALGAEYFFKPGERKLPVKLDDDIYQDAVRIKLPPGLSIDEMPDAVRLEIRYGAYSASWK